MGNTAYSKCTKADYVPDILMYTTNYAARTVNIDNTGVIAGPDGRKIVPAGTFLGGFFENPNNPAKKIGVDSVKASLTTTLSGDNSNMKFVSRLLGAAGDAISIAYVKPSKNNASLSVTVSGMAISVSLATGATGDIVSTAREVAGAVNSNSAANDLVLAELTGDGSGVVAAMAVADLSGGNDGAGGTAEGVLRHPLDVTDGIATGTAVIAGFIDIDMLPDAPTDAIKAAMPTVRFMKRN